MKEKRDGAGGSPERAAILRIVLPYLVLGAAWILFSDRILTLFQSDPDLVIKISTAKGWFYILVTAALLYVLVSREFSRRAALERRLEEDNAEKAVLLAEIHHRVKNNLQIISSILSLEEGEADSDEARKLCVTTASRVRSMALVHETLYADGNFASLDLAQYLRDLCGSIDDIYGRGGALFSFDLVTSRAMPDIAVPFGLFVSEAVTNAVRHGLPEDGNWTAPPIHVSLVPSGEDRLRFSVRDSGSGFGPPPGGASPPPAVGARGLGLSLMRSLAEQLGGNLGFGYEDGGLVTLEFSPRPRRRAQAGSRARKGLAATRT